MHGPAAQLTALRRSTEFIGWKRWEGKTGVARRKETGGKARERKKRLVLVLKSYDNKKPESSVYGFYRMQ